MTVGVTQCNHKGPHDGEAGGSESEEMWCQKTRSEKERDWRCYTACFEDGGGATSEGMPVSLEAGKGQEMDPPLEPPEEPAPPTPWFRTSGL